MPSRPAVFRNSNRQFFLVFAQIRTFSAIKNNNYFLFSDEHYVDNILLTGLLLIEGCIFFYFPFFFLLLILPCFIEIPVFIYINTVDPDLDLHGFPMSLLWDVWHNCVKADGENRSERISNEIIIKCTRISVEWNCALHNHNMRRDKEHVSGFGPCADSVYPNQLALPHRLVRPYPVRLQIHLIL